MAEDEDRKVEPRTGVVGSGMLTDPERIEALQAERARRERNWRNPPKKGFGDVIKGAPKKRFERVGVYVPADERVADEEAEEAPEEKDERAEAGAAELAEGEGVGPETPPPVEQVVGRGLKSALPPDPRMAALNRMLDANVARGKGGGSR